MLENMVVTAHLSTCSRVARRSPWSTRETTVSGTKRVKASTPCTSLRKASCISPMSLIRAGGPPFSFGSSEDSRPQSSSPSSFMTSARRCSGSETAQPRARPRPMPTAAISSTMETPMRRALVASSCASRFVLLTSMFLLWTVPPTRPLNAPAGSVTITSQRVQLSSSTERVPACMHSPESVQLWSSGRHSQLERSPRSARLLLNVKNCSLYISSDAFHAPNLASTARAVALATSWEAFSASTSALIG
mmetsp:Transcript_31045/g.88983  ORF Transcript_31045/g.88983 Transcript_31045/m.88983 type:complete len:248 (+) Transcript_31045:708-1451(+)